MISGRLTRFGLLCSILACASVADAQAPPLPTSVELLVLPPGSDPATAAPIATRSTPIGVSQNCGLTSTGTPPPTPLINPTKGLFDDPFTAGRFCQADIPTGLPNGTNYLLVARFIAPSCLVNGVNVSPCPGPRSSAGLPPFTIQAATPPPVAPTGLVVRP